MLAEVPAGLRAVFGTAQDVFLFAGSGTAMMEASLANVVGPGDAVLVVVAGQFGERFAAIAKALGAEVDTLDVEWGAGHRRRSSSPSASTRRDYRAVVVVHNESSTGVTEDLAAIGAVVRERPTAAGRRFGQRPRRHRDEHGCMGRGHRRLRLAEIA